MIGTSRMMAGEIEPGIADLLRSLEIGREGGFELRIASAPRPSGSACSNVGSLAPQHG
jgi:hypothetical protein